MDRTQKVMKQKIGPQVAPSERGAWWRDEIKMRDLKFMAYLIQALLHSMSPKTLVWGYHCRRPVLYH